MSKVTMPDPVAFAITNKLYPKDGPALHADASFAVDDDDLLIESLITTTQAEAYADARVREALRSLLRDMNGHVRAAHSRFGETGKPYDEGRRIAYEQAAADIRALIPPLPGPVEP